jgi:checkpoint serine/threonine-protein kinase
MAARNSDKLDKERRKYRALITTALTEDEDPLAAYEQFVQWTVKTYGMEDPNSGLLDLLEETTRQFKDDDGYKGNRRYLDLWVMYAKLVEDPVTVYSFLVENGIGSAFCLLYEEYARVLERDGL